MRREATHTSVGAADRSPAKAQGRTRWERMERNTLTLERLSALHAAAYRAENKSERTVEWHSEAIARYAAWVEEALSQTPALATFTLDNVRAYVSDLRTQTCWVGVEHMPEASRAKPLSDGTVSW